MFFLLFLAFLLSDFFRTPFFFETAPTKDNSKLFPWSSQYSTKFNDSGTLKFLITNYTRRQVFFSYPEWSHTLQIKIDEQIVYYNQSTIHLL